MRSGLAQAHPLIHEKHLIMTPNHFRKYRTQTRLWLNHPYLDQYYSAMRQTHVRIESNKTTSTNPHLHIDSLEKDI